MKVQPINVLLIDDHKIILQGLKSLLSFEPDIYVMGDALSISDGFNIIEHQNPDVIVVDISLEHESGIELIKDCQIRYPNISILVLSMHDESVYAIRAIQAGALGYLMKKESMEEVANGIRSVYQKKLFVSDKIKNQLLNQVSGISSSIDGLPISSLSDREFEVFSLIGKGKRPRHIAQELNISPRTVATHCSRIREKINIDSIDDLIDLASKWVSGNHKLER